MTSFVQHLAGGLFLGSIYALVAIGYSLMWSTTKAVNFAHGDSLMLTAVATVLLLGAGAPLWLAAGIALALVAVYGALVHRALVQPFAGAANTSGWILATIATGVMIEAAVNVLFGSLPRPLPSPAVQSPVTLLGASLYLQEWIAPLIVLAIAAFVSLFQRRTLVGRAMRAIAENPDAAGLMGIDARRVATLTFAASAALGGVAGLLVAPIIQVQAQMGVLIGLKGFAVAIAAGAGSLWSVVLLGALFGVGEQFVSAYAGSGFRDAAVFALVILLLLLRPEGLFGRREVKKV
ncbi:branched-chain amino acid ABC transporter permease [Methylopila musalis]|uniref:Branched-chain amino acid ABC transporter permease n=1 Tax=Methylopila musalis TaxID=1134781 RepID=A0ABW3ZAA4_9HYPH